MALSFYSAYFRAPWMSAMPVAITFTTLMTVRMNRNKLNRKVIEVFLLARSARLLFYGHAGLAPPSCSGHEDGAGGGVEGVYEVL